MQKAGKFRDNTISVYVRNRTLEMPDAFIAGNDQSAIGCMKALINEGYRIPGDISVIGFDDIAVSQYFTPKLSTVRNPIDLQGITAARMLVNMIENNKKGSIEQLNSELMARESAAVMLRN